MIEIDVISVEQKLAGLKRKKKQAIRERDDLETSAEKVRVKKQKTEESLDATMTTIRELMKNVTGCVRFQKVYGEKAKGVIYGSSSQSAIAEYDDALTQSKNKIETLNGQIASYQKQIEALESELAALKAAMADND